MTQNDCKFLSGEHCSNEILKEDYHNYNVMSAYSLLMCNFDKIHACVLCKGYSPKKSKFAVWYLNYNPYTKIGTKTIIAEFNSREEAECYIQTRIGIEEVEE